MMQNTNKTHCQDKQQMQYVMPAEVMLYHKTGLQNPLSQKKTRKNRLIPKRNSMSLLSTKDLSSHYLSTPTETKA